MILQRRNLSFNSVIFSADGSCNAETCGYGGTCLKNGRCRCSRGHTGPNAKKVGAVIEVSIKYKSCPIKFKEFKDVRTDI